MSWAIEHREYSQRRARGPYQRRLRSCSRSKSLSFRVASVARVAETSSAASSIAEALRPRLCCQSFFAMSRGSMFRSRHHVSSFPNPVTVGVVDGAVDTLEGITSHEALR